MLINPLNTCTETCAQTTSNTDVVSDIISFLIQNHREYLSDISINKENVERIVREKVYKEYASLNTETTIKTILDRLFGYYILQKYIDKETISDIRVTRFDNIMIKEMGEWKKTKEAFFNEADFLNFIRYCILKNKGKITTETPIVTVSDRQNHLRIEAGIEPVNVSSPNLVIRIHRPKHQTSLEELFMTKTEMMSISMYRFLKDAMTAGLNIVISGKGGSGKTTLLRNLVNCIPEDLSITANEETAELYSTHPNIIEREVVLNRSEDKNITLEMLMSHSLVMSNDVIVVGELKGAEAMSFFDAVSTGHRGYATVHADSSTTTIDRLVTLMKRDVKAQMYTDQYLRKLLSQSLNLIVFMKDFKIHEVSEVIFDEQKNDVRYESLFEYCETIDLDGNKKGMFMTKNEPSESLKQKMNLAIIPN